MTQDASAGREVFTGSSWLATASPGQAGPAVTAIFSLVQVCILAGQSSRFGHWAIKDKPADSDASLINLDFKSVQFHFRRPEKYYAFSVTNPWVQDFIQGNAQKGLRTR
jgi:hypothetical protein